MKFDNEKMARLLENVSKPPKYTKEQKVITKALQRISLALNERDARKRTDFLNYASGLLEALLFQDDKEEG